MDKMTSNNKLKIARKYQKEIKKLEDEQNAVYRRALKELKIEDSGAAWDYFINGFDSYVDEVFGADKCSSA